MAVPTVETLRDLLYAGEDNFQPGIGQLCLNAARQYLADSGVPETETGYTYELACLMLAAYWYDHRDQIGTVPGDLQTSVNAITLQLRDVI